MKTCFSTLGCHDLKLDEILNLGNKYHVSAIEVRGIDSEMSNSKIIDFQKENCESTTIKFKNANIIPFILSTSCKFHNDETRERMIQKAYQEIEIAYRNHFYGIRVFGNLIENDQDKCILKVAYALNDICKYALKYNIHIFLEVHGDFNTIEVLKQLIKDIHYDNFSLIWDVCHTHSVYKDNWKLFYNELKDHIKHVHLKDIKDNELVLPGKGEIDLLGIVRYMIEDGYDGYFSLEWERKWFSELEPLEVALQAFNELFSI